MWHLIAASLIFSFSFGFIGHHLAGLPPAWVAGVRLSVAALLFSPFARRITPRTAVALLLVGMVQFGGMSLAYMRSFHYLASHEVAFFTIMTPVYVVTLDGLCRRSFNRLHMGMALLSVCGAGLILWRGIASSAPLKGFLLVQVANLCFAAGQLGYRDVTNRAPHVLRDREAILWLYLGGIAALTPFALHEQITLAPRPSATQLGILLYLGALASGLSAFLRNAGTRRVHPGMLAVMNNAKIPLGMLASLLCFGEPIQGASLLAGALLLAAALFFARTRRNP